MLRHRLFRFLTRLTLPAGRRWVYVAAALLTLAALVRIPSIEILTSRQGMVSDDLPVQADFLAYMEDFGSPTQLIVVLEGETERIKTAADALAAALSADREQVRNVFHRIDLEAFRAGALYYLPVERLRELAEFLSDTDRRSTLLESRDLAAVLTVLEESSGSASREILDHPGFVAVESLLGSWESALREGGGSDLGLEDKAGSLIRDLLDDDSAIDPEGYLLSDDRRLAFLFVQQTMTTDDAAVIVPFIEHVRSVAEATLIVFPEVTYGLTGWPAAIAEDYGLLVSDLPRVSLLATALILGIFFAAFRSFHRTILVFVPLACGLVWALGLTEVFVGHLNYLSSVFIGVLFGLGIDFGIYFIRRFDEERLTDPDPSRAVRRTLSTAGQGVVTGGLTAVVAFLAIWLTDQPAFSELGIVAALGVGCVLLATVVLLPALLVQKPPGLAGIRREVGSPLLEGSAGVLLRRPGLVAIAVAVVGLLLAASIPGLGFDYDLNNLLPADSEAVRVLRDMEKRSPYSDQFVVLVADDMEQVRALHHVLAEQSTVRRVESLATALPADVDAKRPLVREIAGLIPPPGRSEVSPGDASELEARLRSLVERLQEGEEDAFASGRTETALQVGNLATRFERIADLLGAPGGEVRELRFEDQVFDTRDRLVTEVRTMTTSPPVTLESLDPSLRERFVGKSGRLALLAFPTRPIWDPEYLDRFIEETREAATRVLGATELGRRMTGFAVVFHVTGPAIRQGFAQATWMAAIVVTLMLLVDLRRPTLVLLALTPLLATCLVLLGGMSRLNIELTMATQVAFPILFGLGVAYGVHMVHRLTEETCASSARAVGTTGKAIALAAATTMAGFASMAVAKHSGLVSFGVMLFCGILVSVLSALFVLPVLAALLGLGRDPG